MSTRVAEAMAAVVEPMEQWPGEIVPFAEWLTREGLLGHVVEIGVRRGGTVALWHGLSSGLVIGVDWHQKDSLGAEETTRVAAEMQRRHARYRLIIGDSHAPETRARVEAMLGGSLADLVFIDGDHSYDGVRVDFEAYRTLVRPGGVVAFHDIVDTAFMRGFGHGVYRFWQELKPTVNTFEFCVGGDWGGIGAVVV